MTFSTRVTRLAALAVCLLAAAGCHRDGNGDGEPRIAGPSGNPPAVIPIDPDIPDGGDNEGPLGSECSVEPFAPSVPAPPVDDDGGPDSPDEAPFDVMVTPGVLTLAPGTTAEVSVLVWRADGFDDRVDVAIDGLPDGVTSSSLELLVGQTAGTIAISAGDAVAVRDNDISRVRGRSLDRSSSATLLLRVRGEPLTRDPSFGTRGFHQMPEDTESVRGLVEQPDGKLAFVVEGDSSVLACRVDRDGTIDDGFGADGCVNLAPVDTAELGIARLRDGSLVVAWAGETSVNLAKLSATGAYDPAFGDFGRVSVANMPATTSASPLSLLAVGGRLFVGRGDTVVRLRQDSGEIDPSFGTYGRVHESGKLIPRVCGVVVFEGDSLVGLNWDGDRDPTFGAAGQASLPFTPVEVIRRGSGFVAASVHAQLANVSSAGETISLSDELEHFDVREMAADPDGSVVLSGRYFFEDEGVDGLAVRLLDGTTRALETNGGGDTISHPHGLRVSGDGRYLRYGTWNHSNASIERLWD